MDRLSTPVILSFCRKGNRAHYWLSPRASASSMGGRGSRGHCIKMLLFVLSASANGSDLTSSHSRTFDRGLLLSRDVRSRSLRPYRTFKWWKASVVGPNPYFHWQNHSYSSVRKDELLVATRFGAHRRCEPVNRMNDVKIALGLAAL